MKKILIAAAISTVGMYASGLCTGPNSGTNDVNVYSDVTLQSNTILALDSADSCSVNGTVFSNFQVAGGAGANFTAPNTGFSLTVDVIASNEVEFAFSNLGAGDIELYYTITNGVNNMILEAGTTSSVSEVICSTAYTVPNSTCTGTVLNGTSPFGVTSGTPMASTIVAPAVEDFIVKDIGGGSEVFQIVAPEPMTLSLMGAGLLGLGIFGRRRSSK